MLGFLVYQTRPRILLNDVVGRTSSHLPSFRVMIRFRSLRSADGAFGWVHICIELRIH